MKVLIVEEALKTLHGHWFQYVSDIVCGGLKAGHQIDVAVHRDACGEILEGLPCLRILTESVFDAERSSRFQGGSLGRIMRHNAILFRDLAPLILDDKATPYDVIIATTPRLDHLLAYQRLAMNVTTRSRLRFVLLMIESVGRYAGHDDSTLRFSPKTIPLRLAMTLASCLPGGERMLFATESEGLARQYEKFCGRRFPLVPHVTELPDLTPYRIEVSGDGRSAKGLTFGTYGFTRYDKGLDILQSSLRLLLSKKEELPGGNFVIQWTGDYRLPDGTLIGKDPLLTDLPGVRYIREFSSSEEYYRWIAQTDVMLLPYRRGFYRDKLSRVAIDAALAGIPIIYPEGTWLEDFVMNHAAGVAFEGGNPQSLSQAIETSMSSYGVLKEQATSRKGKTSTDFSARTFFEKILSMTDTKDC
jgi:glycosyltransferase involved in cell wall biosynthesis